MTIFKPVQHAFSAAARCPSVAQRFYVPLGTSIRNLSASSLYTSPSPDGTEGSAAGSTPLSTTGPLASRLKSRGVIRFDGPEVIKFLQGLVTNDVSHFEREPPSAGSAMPTPNQPAKFYPPLYSALLNPQGRFLYDLVFYRPTKSEKLDRTGSGPGASDSDSPVLLADVDASTLDELLDVLKKHRLRAKVDFENISNELAVWTRFGGALSEDAGKEKEQEAGGIGYGGTDDASGKAAAEGSMDGWQWLKDPRLSALGLRGVFPQNATPPLVEADSEKGEEYYQLWRYEHGVPEGPVEIPKDEAIPLEYNFEALNAISFDKGCYVGQELIARTHHRGVIRKRLFPVQFLSPEDSTKEAQRAAVPGAEVIDTSSGKKVGKVTGALGPRGLALLRLDPALKEGAKLQVEGDGAVVHVQRPSWWPSEWGM
eukprot:jgi/Mesen1/3103/ME000184S02172